MLQAGSHGQASLATMGGRGRAPHRHHHRSASASHLLHRQCRCRAAQDALTQGDAGAPQRSESPAPSDGGGVAPAQARAPSPDAVAKSKLPKTGYFSLADPTAEVYSRAGEAFDPTKRGGRFKPEFIWNTDWQKTLEMQESLQRRRDAAVKGGQGGQQQQQQQQSPAGAAGAPAVGVVKAQVGAVGLSRLADLDRMDVDLSEALRAAAKRDAELQQQRQQQQQQQRGGSPGAAAAARTVPLPRNDVKRLERSSRASKGMVTTVVGSTPEDQAAKAELQAQELRMYEQEKTEQRLWTAALSLVGAASTYASYGREVCISYTLGALGGYVYLRLLGRSVDGMAGQGGLVSGVASAVGNQRLLIPVILALGYNRWNTLFADDYGVHLNLLAMLVGFLTYKIAVVTRQGKLVMDDIAKSMQRGGADESS